jgi:AbrB family looped-hinge helix DNA binding protein
VYLGFVLYKRTMETKIFTIVTKRGQTVVPAPIRKKQSIREGDRLAWLDDGRVIKVIPIPADPIQALRGRGRGGKLVEALLRARKDDQSYER